MEGWVNDMDQYNVCHSDGFWFSATGVDLGCGDTAWDLRKTLRALHDKLPSLLSMRAIDTVTYRSRTFSCTKKLWRCEWVHSLTWIPQPFSRVCEHLFGMPMTPNLVVADISCWYHFARDQILYDKLLGFCICFRKQELTPCTLL